MVDSANRAGRGSIEATCEPSPLPNQARTPPGTATTRPAPGRTTSPCSGRPAAPAGTPGTPQPDRSADDPTPAPSRSAAHRTGPAAAPEASQPHSLTARSVAYQLQIASQYKTRGTREALSPIVADTTAPTPDNVRSCPGRRAGPVGSGST